MAVARHGRLAKAARALRVEHTTVGRRIEAFELSLGGPLFDRTAGGYLLTRAGRRVLEQAEAMAEAARRFEMGAHESRQAVEGRVRVALIESFAVTWLCPRIGELCARYPRLELQVLTGNVQSDLSRGEAELAVRTPRPAQRELAAVKLGASDFALFATRAVAARIATPGLEGELPELGEVPLLMYTADLTFLQSAPWFAALARRSRVVTSTNSTLALMAAARACVLPEFAVRSAPDLLRVSRREVLRTCGAATYSLPFPRIDITAD